jgi:uncharacterized protein
MLFFRNGASQMAIRFIVLPIILLVFIASQFYWFRRARDVARRLIHSRSLRRVLAGTAIAGLVAVFTYNLGFFGRSSPTHMTLRVALLEIPFKLWFFGSLLGFVLTLPFWAADRLIKTVRWIGRRRVGSAKPAVLSGERVPGTRLASPARRRFLEQAAMAVGAVPFAAGTYGLLYERLDIETTQRRIALRRLPKAFNGFRILQLSDIHIGPFMTEDEIRNVVATANGQKPDLIVLTGDYVTWDPSTQVPVVRVLSGLRAPFGVYGCLGNHEAWSGTEDSIARLFSAQGIKILRQGRVLITPRTEDDRTSPAPNLNLIGVDFQTRTRMRGAPRGEHYVRKYLAGVENLVQRDCVNILMSHNPNTFDRAAELGIDLSLAGHTHGGQVSLEFVNQNISPSRLITPYVKGWFCKGNAQLYVNRGIGTIGIPIRIGSAPEISVFELVREA